MKLSLDKNKKYLLACSFGPDSMALFSLLLAEDYYFEVAHVNYHMREESDSEQLRLAAFCKEKNIVLHTTDAFYSKKYRNFQAWAREARYDYFKEIINNNSLDVLLTGHQLDDVLETYLMQKEKKANLFYFGIRERTIISGIQVVRPLIGYPKNLLIDHCTNTQTPFAIDASNLSVSYRRNFLRNRVIARMGSQEKTMLLEEILARNEYEMDKTQRLKEYISNRGTMQIAKFTSLSIEDKARIVYMFFTKYDQAAFFHQGHVKVVDTILRSDKTTALVKVKHNIYLTKFYQDFAIIDINEYRPYEEVVSKEQKSVKSRHVYFDLQGDLSRYNIKQSSFPLVIRTYRAGDTYKIKNYSKKVSRLFIDMKLPKHLRLIWPIVVDKTGTIIYIPRYRHDYIFNENDKLNVLW